MKLRAPDEWWELTPGQQIEITNGCGPKAIERLIPDSIFRLSIVDA